MTEPKDTLQHTMNRRGVIKAAAWTAPVVAAAAVVPRAAASGEPEPGPVTGAYIAATNINNKRGVAINLSDDDGNTVPLPAGAVITLTVTDSGTLAGPLTVSGGTFSGGTPSSLTAGTYTITATGGSQFRVSGTISGNLTFQAEISGDNSDGHFDVSTQTASLHG